MKKKEQEFTTKLQKWMKYNMRHTFCWEAKVCYTNRLNYKGHIPQHQVKSLAMCGSHFVYKISDMDRMQKPMDGVSISESPGFFFIKFWKPGEKKFYIIEVSQLEKEIKAGSKSLTEERAKQIAYRIGELK